MAEPTARVPLHQVCDLVEAAVEATDDELLGLHAAQHRSLSDFESFAFLLTTSATLDGALSTCQAFRALLGEQFEIVSTPERVTLRYARLGPPRPAQRHLVEMIAYDWAHNLRHVVGGAARVERVRFAHEPPAWRAALEAALACPVEFGAPHDEWVLPAAALAQPMPSANAAMHDFFRRYAERQLERLPDSDDVVVSARAWVRDRLRDGDVGLAALARGLGMGERTLQRRLADAGTTARALVDDVRRDRAIAMLEEARSVAEIAAELGFSEASAFHRAFKRWTGRTPESLRRTA